MSSFFTAVTFWAILKWERVADTTYSFRWLIFIAFLIGLSIGVHLLNLLCIPAIIYVVWRRSTDRRSGGSGSCESRSWSEARDSTPGRAAQTRRAGGP